MASTNTPRSFRPGKARAAQMDAWAAERGLKPAEALAAMVDVALGVNTQPPPKVRAGKEAAVPINTSSIPLKEGVRLIAPSDDRARWAMFRTKAPAKTK